MEPLLHSGFGTYPNRPSRVMKSGSRNPSPRNRGIRRMTTHLPARTRSVVDPQRSNINFRQPNPSQGRPMSWHADFVNEYQHYQTFPAHFEQQQYGIPGDATVAYGLPTPSAFPVVDEAFFDCPDMALEHMNMHEFHNLQSNYQFSGIHMDRPEDNNFLYPSVVTNFITADSFAPPTSAWPYITEGASHAIQTAPVSPEFLPFPDLETSFDEVEVEIIGSKDELVGMGLYDSPADVQSADLLFGGSLPVRRKSLKLEESFEPGPLSDVDDADADADADTDAGSDDEADSKSMQQSHSSVTGSAAVPEAHSSTQLQIISNGINFDGLQSNMGTDPEASIYPAMSAMMAHHVSGWL